MSLLAEDIKNLSAPQKAELYYLLSDDGELKDYMIPNNMLFEELIRRDKAYAEGKIQLTTRKELSPSPEKSQGCFMIYSNTVLQMMRGLLKII